MEAGKTDRRVKYTKALLRDALVELMQTQHISGISIKALCGLADVNRSTFCYNRTSCLPDVAVGIECSQGFIAEAASPALHSVLRISRDKRN